MKTNFFVLKSSDVKRLKEVSLSVLSFYPSSSFNWLLSLSNRGKVTALLIAGHLQISFEFLSLLHKGQGYFICSVSEMSEWVSQSGSQQHFYFSDSVHNSALTCFKNWGGSTCEHEYHCVEPSETFYQSLYEFTSSPYYKDRSFSYHSCDCQTFLYPFALGLLRESLNVSEGVLNNPSLNVSKDGLSVARSHFSLVKSFPRLSDSYPSPVISLTVSLFTLDLLCRLSRGAKHTMRNEQNLKFICEGTSGKVATTFFLGSVRCNGSIKRVSDWSLRVVRDIENYIPYPEVRTEFFETLAFWNNHDQGVISEGSLKLSQIVGVVKEVLTQPVSRFHYLYCAEIVCDDSGQKVLKIFNKPADNFDCRGEMIPTIDSTIVTQIGLTAFLSSVQSLNKHFCGEESGMKIYLKLYRQGFVVSMFEHEYNETFMLVR